MMVLMLKQYMRERVYIMKNLVLILVLVVGLFGSELEEIGRPYVDNTDGFIHSAVLAPDGNGLYGLKDDLVTKWQLSPIKKLLSFRTGIVNFPRHKGYQIQVSGDNKRIILYSYKEIQLWDIKSKQHIKTIKEDLTLGTSSKYGFLALTKDNYLQIRSDKDLKLLKTMKINRDDKYSDNILPYNKINGDNILCINYAYDGLFLDLDTLKVIDTFSNDTEEDRKIRRFHRYEISKYKQVYMDKYASKFHSVLWNKYMSFLWDKRHFSTFSSVKYLITRDKTRTSETILYKLRDRSQYRLNKSFINKHGEKKTTGYIFYQFDDTWILHDKRKRFFTGSGNIRKHLKMETKDGKVVPMNDITFKKYNKLIKLKD